MPMLAIDLRPAVTGALPAIAALLLTVVLAVSLECVRRSEHCEPAVITTSRPVVVAMELAPSLPGDVLTPPVHPDARPWPHGMVITPPPTHDRINLAPVPGPLSRLLSTVLGALVPERPAGA